MGVALLLLNVEWKSSYRKKSSYFVKLLWFPEAMLIDVAAPCWAHFPEPST